MNRQEFCKELRKKLNQLSFNDVEKSVDFYNEIISDYMEEGLSEEEAIEKLGNIDDIVNTILSENNFDNNNIENINNTELVENINQEKHRNKKLIILLIATSIIWGPLAFAAIVTLASLIVAFICIVLSLYVADVCIFVGGFIGFVAEITSFSLFYQFLYAIGSLLVKLGGSVLLFFGLNKLVSFIIKFLKSTVKKLVKKGGASR